MHIKHNVTIHLSVMQPDLPIFIYFFDNKVLLDTNKWTCIKILDYIVKYIHCDCKIM